MSNFEVGDKVIYDGASNNGRGQVGLVSKIYYGNGVSVLYSVQWVNSGEGGGYTSADLRHFPTTPEGIEEWLADA